MYCSLPLYKSQTEFGKKESEKDIVRRKHVFVLVLSIALIIKYVLLYLKNVKTW